MRSIFRRFVREERGSFMILSILMVLAIILGTAGAVEVARILRVQTDAQDALDAAVLAAARRDDPTQPQETGENFFNAALATRGVNAEMQQAQFRFNEDDNRVRGAAELLLDTPLMAIAGRRTVTIKVVSEAAPARRPMTEVALVLDVSGSMAQSASGGGGGVAPVGSRRIDALVTAVDTLLDSLFEDEQQSDRVRISVTPYSTSVDVSDYAASAVSGVSVNGNGPPLLGPRGGRNATNTIWAAERHQSGFYNVTDNAPAAMRIPFWSALDYGGVPVFGSFFRPSLGILPLTNSRRQVETFVGALEPAGATAGHIGMAWGLYSIAPDWSGVWGGAAPMAYGTDDGRKVIVMMTDGQFNTFFRPTAVGGDSTSHSYAYFQSVCRLAESRAVTIFTIAFQAPPTAAAQLATCATPDGGAYTPTNRQQLIDAFEAIGRKTTSLRLTG